MRNVATGEVQQQDIHDHRMLAHLDRGEAGLEHGDVSAFGATPALAEDGRRSVADTLPPGRLRSFIIAPKGTKPYTGGKSHA